VKRESVNCWRAL